MLPVIILAGLLRVWYDVKFGVQQTAVKRAAEYETSIPQ
jgi:hypothetical protein